MEHSLKDFQQSHCPRHAVQIQPDGMSAPLSRKTIRPNQFSSTDFATGVNLEKDFAAGLQRYESHAVSGLSYSMVDTSASGWNGQQYHKFGSSCDYTVDEAIPDTSSTVECNLYFGQITPPYTVALPISGNAIAQGSQPLAPPLDGHEQNRSDTRTSLRGCLAGSGMWPRNNLKSEYLFSCKQATVNGIKKIEKKGGGKPQLAKALLLIGQVRSVLEAYPICAAAIKTLEESISEMICLDPSTSRGSTAHIRASESESDNYSSTNQLSYDDSISLSTTTDFSYLSQNDRSMTFSSCGSIPNQDFMDMTMDNQTLHIQAPKKTVYRCTVPIDGILCETVFRSEGDWVRHEESYKHCPQRRYMCLECIEHMRDEDDNPVCAFCSQQLPPASSIKTHYLQCQKAQSGKHVFNAARKDHFRNHLRGHGIADITPEAQTWIFAVESDWERQCGFCTQMFTTWDERKHHVANHFKQGMDISCWRLPSPKKKKPSDDYRPGTNHKRHDDDDDDDDDDNSQNNRPKGHHTTTQRFSSQPTSGPVENSHEYEYRQVWGAEECMYNTQNAPTNMQKVEAYLERQSQWENKEDRVSLSDTDNRSSYEPEDSIPLSSSLQKSGITEVYKLWSKPGWKSLEVLRASKCEHYRERDIPVTIFTSRLTVYALVMQNREGERHRAIFSRLTSPGMPYTHNIDGLRNYYASKPRNFGFQAEQWLQNRSSLLLGQGDPGAGKTVLASCLAKGLITRFETDGGIDVAYLACEVQRQCDQKFEDLLSGLKRSIQEQPTMSDIPYTMAIAYEHHEVTVERHCSRFLEWSQGICRAATRGQGQRQFGRLLGPAALQFAASRGREEGPTLLLEHEANNNYDLKPP
ncbi:hypothetical protein BP6252_14104 [Coleophoma cylindrospora]|uniref:Nephrocystin 3-like N-terminal domain-containing protein n=1 Tax=Coleophoma cylindrospora TaxID=1849047 RepID=A0A3D8Q570_9HELO|nr:hypothetical protein BP6252_14104 [Coleophoma cylindrospora]